MIAPIVPWLGDALAVLGLVVLTLSVYGLLRFPSIITRIHATGQAAVMGVVPVLIAAMLGGDAAAVSKSVLIGGFLVLTSPIVAHEIGRAAHLARREGLADGEEARQFVQD